MVFLIILMNSTVFSQLLSILGRRHRGLVQWATGVRGRADWSLLGAMFLRVDACSGCSWTQVSMMLITVPIFYAPGARRSALRS